jgi:hypothetical protein
MKPKSFLCIIATALFLASPIVQAHEQPTNSFSGRAFVVYAKVLGLLETTIVDTGPLPDVGGVREENAVEVNIPALLMAQLLHAKTTGGQTLDGWLDPNVAESEAEVLKLALTLAGLTVKADVIRAMTRAECDDGKPQLSGDSEIVNLTLNGQSIVHVAPNQKTTLNLLGVGSVQVQLDEQIKQGFSKSGFPGGKITVNAVHIKVLNVLGLITAEVIISSAKSNIICGLAPSDP